MRRSGILMHITSLPGPYGVGTMGEQAYRFVDFLKKAGQSFWQVLPLTPTGYGDSPYQSCSNFAGNYYLVDLGILVKDGLLTEDQIQQRMWNVREDRVDFGLLYQNRLEILRLAFDNFSQEERLDRFCLENSDWLPDYALYMALKDENGGKPWYQWREDLKRRKPDAVWQARNRLKREIRFYCFVQYLFYTQWYHLLNYAHENGVSVIGDVPIYVPLDSVDVWSDPDLFLLDEDLTPLAVAGCPPDAFTQDGQMWGNPLYRWDRMKKDNYRWWLHRLEKAGELYDVVRLDHFRAFEAYWSVPYGAPTARDGCWVEGPGMDFIQTLKRQLPGLQLIAEDLGYLTPAVLALRDASGYPGMKVLEFAFDSREPSLYLPHNYIHNTVCYTGTHDNMTLKQWLETSDPDVVEYATEYMGLNRQEGLVRGVIRTALSSISRLCIVQMQDWLELGGEARMNFPGTMDNNWCWRALPGSYDDALAEAICRLTGLYGRYGNKLEITLNKETHI